MVSSSPNQSPETPRLATRSYARHRTSGGHHAPARARALRVVLLELERLYNHTADIGALATDVAFTVPASRAQALREGLVRLQDELFGTRLLRGTIALGVTATCRRRRATPFARTCKVREAVRRTDPLLVDAGTFTDRVDGTGVLSQQAARDLGIVGMAARASGVDGDLRRDHPNDAYEGLRFECPSKKVEMSGHGSWCVHERSSSRW